MIDMDRLMDVFENNRSYILRHRSGFQIPSKCVVTWRERNVAPPHILGQHRKPIPRYVHEVEYYVPGVTVTTYHTASIDPCKWDLVFPDEETKQERMTPEEYREEKPMHDAEIRSALKRLAQQEADFATARYGLYHSPHEGLAIIEEEAEEAKAEYKHMQMDASGLRFAVRTNLKNPAEYAGMVRAKAISLAQEAIHVAATAQRFIEASDAKKDEFADGFAPSKEEAQ